MSILLSVQHLSKSHGSRVLFEDLSFGLFEGERTGLIGPNGAGKSTLVKILAGRETADTGEVVARRGLRVRFLPQETESLPDGGTVRETLIAALEGSGPEPHEIETRVEASLSELGFDPDRPAAALSGGWEKRLAILSEVLADPDLLLLDEPTNHLDLEGVLWLERLLSQVSFSLLVVTHDRRFLEAVCNRVIELNRRYPAGHFTSGGRYSDFLENREKFFVAQAAQEESMRNAARRELEWLRRGPKARTTKQKARIDRADALLGALDDLTARNAADKTAAIDFSAGHRASKKLIELVGVSKSRGGRPLFGPLDLTLGPGDKWGLIGRNGSGKSTLLKVLSGELPADGGTVKRLDGARVVVFDQHREQLNLDWPLRKALCENGETVRHRDRPIHVAGWAERFLFSKRQLDVPLRNLSGGEQARVLIARLMLRPADVLLLDEPTNDLDVGTLDVLEESLIDFPGALVLVTHDRFLLDRVCRGLVSLDGKGHARLFAGLDQWEEAQEAEEAGPAAPARAASMTPKEPKRGLSKEEAKELRKVEAAIAAGETDRAAAQAALDDPAVASNGAELIKRQAALEDINARLAVLLGRWEELESRR